MNTRKEFELTSPVKKIVFKIPIVNIKWKCCISGDIIDTSFIEVTVETYRNYTVEFIQFMRKVIELFKEITSKTECVIAEEIVTWIKSNLEGEYPLHEITVKLVFLEKDKETGIVSTVEVEA